MVSECTRSSSEVEGVERCSGAAAGEVMGAVSVRAVLCCAVQLPLLPPTRIASRAHSRTLSALHLHGCTCRSSPRRRIRGNAHRSSHHRPRGGLRRSPSA